MASSHENLVPGREASTFLLLLVPQGGTTARLWGKACEWTPCLTSGLPPSPDPGTPCHQAHCALSRTALEWPESPGKGFWTALTSAYPLQMFLTAPRTCPGGDPAQLHRWAKQILGGVCHAVILSQEPVPWRIINSCTGDPNSVGAGSKRLQVQ